MLSRLTRGFALLSLVAAIALETWFARAAYSPLLTLVLMAAAAGFAGGLFRPMWTAAAIMPFAYTMPALLLLLIGMFQIPFLLVWSGALTGLLLSDRERFQWHFPARWRGVLVLWTLTIAVGWPLTALREIDFTSLALLERYRIPNTGIGGSPTMMMTWATDTAIVHLLGLLWFDWLFRYGRDRFERSIALPLLAGTVVGSLLAIYQGTVDVTFLSTGTWIEVGRAAGSLLDANAFGMVAAMWTAAALALSGRGAGRWLAPGASAVSGAGAWMSGSRTALLTILIACGAIAAAMLRRQTRYVRRRAALAVAVIFALVLAATSLLPLDPASPLARLRNTLPADLSREQLRSFAHTLWDRDGYGIASTALIAQRPVAGIGVGMFNMFGATYLQEHVAPLLPDNAQNWWRHHIAELGFAGAASLLVWTVLFLAYLLRTGGSGETIVPAAAVKGALIAIGLASLFGVPAQSLPVSLTFWAFAFWYTCLVEPGRTFPAGSLRPGAWAAVGAVLMLYVIVTLVLARGDLRPAFRAAAGGWRYTYGMYEPPVSAAEGETIRWTERRGVSVVPVDGPWMILTIRAEHPDLEARPVRAVVHVNGREVVNRTLGTNAPLMRAVDTGPAPRAVLEARVDRTWQRAGAPAEIGLALSWTFADAAPAGVPVVRAERR